MNSSYLNYDAIANEYNQRYPSAQQWERGQALLDLARHHRASAILEAGSGTGYWLNLLGQVTPSVFGMDFSQGMLEQSRSRPAPLKLARATAIQLPYKNNSFDLVYCVDAIHHFVDHHAFIDEAFRVLKPGGALAVIGHDPHEAAASNWYIYHYFEGVYDTDIRRYPAGTAVARWMHETGFEKLSSQVIEHINNLHVGESVLKDPFLKYNATSQLALLSEQTYEAGIQKITEALAAARQRQERIVFRSEIQVKMILGYKP
jgi:ubiquinone/menaquinone biosynthesis C-methylase UbiE